MFSNSLSSTLLCASLLIHSGISPSHAGPLSEFTVLGAPERIYTFVSDINNLGQIVGSYSEISDPENFKTFIYDKGNYQIIADPAGITKFGILGINDDGQMIGGANFNGSPDFVHGILYDNGIYTVIDHPNALQSAGLAARGTTLQDINNEGQILGSYLDNNRSSHSFIYKDGTITNFKVPKIKSAFPQKINDRGVIVGHYTKQKNQTFGFVYKNKKFTTLKHPKGVHGTFATGINNRGVIVGYYFDRARKGHGFVYDKGKYINIDAPGAVHNTLPGGGTNALSINDKNQIVGYFLEGIFQHGFLVTYNPK